MPRKYLSLTMLALALALLLSACMPYQQRGGTAGAAMGGIAGAVLDQRNPWRGGVIGAALGAIAGATIADISTQGGRLAAEEGRPVEYRTEDGRGYYRADPQEYDTRRRCRRVIEHIYVNDRLVETRVRDICREVRY